MPVPGIDGCFKCAQPGHWLDDCPYAIPARSKAEHEERIRLFVQWWIDGKVDTKRKRQLIAEENDMWRDRAPERKSA